MILEVGQEYVHCEDNVTVVITSIDEDWEELHYREKGEEAEGLASFGWFREVFNIASSYAKQKMELEI